MGAFDKYKLPGQTQPKTGGDGTQPATQPVTQPVTTTATQPAQQPAAQEQPPPPTPQSSLDWARYYLNPSSYAPGAQFFHDVANPQPMTPGPQSWRDWATKEYKPSSADIGTVYGDAWTYGLSPLLLQGANAAGNAAGAGPNATGMSADELRQRIKTAEENVGPQGPFLTAAGYATQPLTYVGGRYLLDPLGRAIEGVKAIPEAIRPLVARTVQGGTQASALSAAKTAGAGGDPAEILKSAAEAFPVGGAISAAVPSNAGRVTQEDIEAQTARAKQAANEELTQLRYPAKQVGYQVGGKAQPTLADLINQRDWALEQSGASPLMRVRASTTAADVAGSTNPNQAGWSPEKGWSTPPSDYGIVTGSKADPGKVLQSIARNTQRVIEEGTPTGGTPGQGGILEDAAQRAARQADMAAKMRQWSSEAGLPGVDVQKQAVELMRQYPIGSEEYNALKSIASVEPGKGGGMLRSMIPTALTGAGEFAASKFGVPGGATIGQLVGQKLGEAVSKPQALAPLIQQEIRRQSAPLTGTAVSPGYGNALANLLIWGAQGAR